MLTPARIILIVTLIVSLSACFSMGSKDEDTTPHYYVIDVDRGHVASHFANNRVLLLKPIRAIPRFRGQQLVFQVGDNEFRQDEHHLFFTAPEEMLTSQLQRWLQKTGLFTQVTTDSSVPADMVLETALTALYGEQREQFPAQATLEMQFFLSSADDSSQSVLFQTGLRVDVDIADSSPPTTVTGWKLGLEELLTTLEQDFSDYFSKVVSQ